MKIKKITTKMLVGIVPCVIVAMLAVATICVELAQTAIRKEAAEKMETKIDAIDATISDKMNSVEYATQGLGRSIGSSILLLTAGTETYTPLLTQYMTESDYIVAIGIFMDPEYWKDPLLNYYVFEDGDEIMRADLSDTDLTPNDWYVSVKTTGEGYYTETYIDATLGQLMTSYVVPMYDALGNFIGALNTDINMSTVQKFIEEISVGKTGKAQLITNTGYFLTGVEAEQVLSDDYMLTSEDSKFYDKSEDILSGEYQEFVIDGVRYYSKGVEGYDWIVLFSMEESELNEACNTMRLSALVAAFVALLICILIIYIISKSIAKPIIGIKQMSELMAQGDFSLDPIAIKSADEVGNMSSALNQMLEANRSEMIEISSNSETVGNNCDELKSAVSDLEQSVDVINTSIRGINEAMMDNSATAEELSASVQEVKAAVGDLTSRAKDSSDMAQDIMKRATKIGEKTQESFDRAMDLTNQYEQKLTVSIQNSKVVEDIQKMAEAINEIADQINLLSLNASIEAARAGEAGRGFAVVAGEIGGLANQTASTVSEIQTTIEKVRESVDTLAKDSHSVIEFINRDITPDYKSFVETVEQYQNDATSIQELSAFVANIASNLNETMEDVNIAIQNIADASQNAAGESSVIIDSVDVVSEHVGNVGRISDEQRNVAETLDTVVRRYKL